MRSIKFLAAFVLAFALFIPMNANAATSFSDVPADADFATEIYQLTDAEVIQGFKDGTFRPDSSVTRAQAAVMLAGALELDTENAKPINYKDVKEDSTAYKSIAAVTEAGIMQGSKDGFKPYSSLTRAQMAIVLTNAFDLEGNNTSSFTDVKKDFYAYEYIDAIYANDITAGYANGTFKPNNPTKRGHFAAFLARTLNETPSDEEEDEDEEEPEETVVELLKKAYANEMALESYSFNGDFNFGLTMPEELKMPETEMFTDLLENVKVEMTGAYVKDPMMMEANMKLTMEGEFGMTMNMPFVMTEEKMWYKFPQLPGVPMPEELQGKFIEIDLAELQELQEQLGQPGGSLDFDLQTELALAISDLFINEFGEDFYQFEENNAIDVPADIDVQKVVKFELTNETLQPFIEKLMKGFLPQFFELMQEPKYAEALGLTAEDIEEAREGLAHIEENIDEIVESIHDVVSINTLNEHIVIDKNDFIALDIMNMDIDFTTEDGVFGLKLSSNMKKSNMNEEITWVIGIPNADEVITMEELEDLEDSFFEDMEDEDSEYDEELEV